MKARKAIVSAACYAVVLIAGYFFSERLFEFALSLPFVAGFLWLLTRFFHSEFPRQEDASESNSQPGR